MWGMDKLVTTRAIYVSNNGGKGGVNNENRVDINQALAAIRAQNGGEKKGGRMRSQSSWVS